MSDILTDARQAIMDALASGDLGESLVDRIIANLCIRIGGAAPYWPKADAEARNRAMLRDRAAGFGFDEIARRNGVTTKTVRRVLVDNEQ